jgi:hypothetical protein
VTAASFPPLLSWLSQKEPVVDELSTANLDARIEQAIQRTERVRIFQERFPPMAADSLDELPPISWLEIERQLRSLAGPDFERASWELEVLKASARTNPPELFYRELLTLAWSLIDDTKPQLATEDDMD